MNPKPIKQSPDGITIQNKARAFGKSTAIFGTKLRKGRIYAMWQAAKLRAKRKRIVFSLAISDIHIPAICPLLDIPIDLEKFGIRYDSPSLDRRNPRIGYTPENTWVVSTRANILKNNATMQELETLTRNLKKCGYT